MIEYTFIVKTSLQTKEAWESISDCKNAFRRGEYNLEQHESNWEGFNKHEELESIIENIYDDKSDKLLSRNIINPNLEESKSNLEYFRKVRNHKCKYFLCEPCLGNGQ